MLKTNSLGLQSEYIVAAKLGMTHARLVRELGQGEMAFWAAHFEIEREQYEQARKDAERDAAKHNVGN